MDVVFELEVTVLATSLALRVVNGSDVVVSLVVATSGGRVVVTNVVGVEVVTVAVSEVSIVVVTLVSDRKGRNFSDNVRDRVSVYDTS